MTLIDLDRIQRLNIELHKRCTGWAAVVRGKLRCSVCGHRLTVNGVAPVATRKMPPWRWHQEIIDRKRAIELGRRGTCDPGSRLVA